MRSGKADARQVSQVSQEEECFSPVENINTVEDVTNDVCPSVSTFLDFSIVKFFHIYLM